MKVILAGSFCVGKTSLISQFVYRRFPYSYQTTLGVRIDKKEVVTDQAKVNMIIWDIGGEQNQSRIPLSYYLGSSGVIYVFDLSRPASYNNLTSDLEFIQKRLPGVPIIIVGNKKDLLDANGLEEVKSLIPVKVDFFTSAKQGMGVEDTFLRLAQAMLDKNGIRR